MTAGSVAAPLIIPIIHLNRAKNHISTNTPVAIQSDSPGVLIYYTLDGSKPVWGQQGAANSGRKYKEPILLPPGRVSVRAVAVTSDGRESSTVTKVFLVELVDSKNRKEDEEKQQSSAGSSLKPTEPRRRMGNASPRSSPAGPRFLNSRLGSTTAAAQRESSQQSLTSSSGPLKQLSSTETSRIHRQTDFLRCAQCLCCRPSDPFAGFCPQCGAVVPPVPGQRLPPAEGGQTLLCLYCNAAVPVKLSSCLICEASVSSQLQPQASVTLQDHVVCVSCGSGNPAHIPRCVTCESRLPSVQSGGADSAPSVHSGEDRMLSCSKCKRINRGDARFCSWCGAKPGHALSCVMCWRCGASGHPYAFYCAACGSFLEAPAPPTSCTDIGRPTGGAAAHRQTAATPSRDATWQPVPPSDPSPSVPLAPPTMDRHTQTVGLFYPSSTELHRKEQQRALELSSKRQTSDRQPLLSAVSPGRGFWRKQLDHVCAHLRSYAQNNAAFRAVLGEPRLGRMVSAVISEDNYEVSLTISFVSAARENPQASAESEHHLQPAGGAARPTGRPESLSSVTERLAADSPGFRKTSKPNLTADVTPKLPLLKALGPGQGQIGVIQQLLDQGADPSCCGTDGRPALTVAVVNGHHDVIPVLVQRGADIDQQSGRMRNTALHEASALGSEGLQSAQVLLSCNASVGRRNTAGQTAYDTALSSGCDAMISLLAAGVEDDTLEKPKLSLDEF